MPLENLWHCSQTLNQAIGPLWLKQTATFCQQGDGILLTQMLWTLLDCRQERFHGFWQSKRAPLGVCSALPAAHFLLLRYDSESRAILCFFKSWVKAQFKSEGTEGNMTAPCNHYSDFLQTQNCILVSSDHGACYHCTASLWYNVKS